MADEISTHVKTPLGRSLSLPGLRLTVVDGPNRGRDVEANAGVVTVGSSPGNDLVLTDGSVSRRHCEVRLHGDRATVRDLASTNGTFVDGVRVMEAVLSPSSRIRLGDSSIRTTPADSPVVIPLSRRTSFGGLLGMSPAIREAFAVLERVARTEATVLIRGETGTGKELAAEALHANSPRADGPFVPIDCGAIAASLIESELFGHVRGAFTGAHADRVGLFEQADGGTLFLDEIGELPLELQPKLLRALEKREVRRVGGADPRPVDVRIVAATNRDLLAEINKNTFREDLYFRLAVVELTLPPLRTRREDIPLLVRHFIGQFVPEHPGPSEELMASLAAQPWPGNVRELRNAVERAVAMLDPTETGPRRGVLGAEAPLSESMLGLFALPYKEGLQTWVEHYERSYLRHILRLSRGSVSGAARSAGVNRRFLQRLMKRHGVTGDGSNEED